METNELSIVITTFKSELKIFTCLDAIPSNVKTIVVENSNDESFKKDIEKKYKNVNCILTGENKGYAKANNIGLSKVKTEFALVLNPDAILEINAIENFLKTAIRYNDFWIIGPGNDQGVSLNFKNSDTIQVNNLKGFAILLGAGMLIGFGARYAGGCTSGHAITGLSSLQFPSLLAVIGFFIGGIIATWFIIPILFS